jgi:multicomponent Na+:H+ antiporter subunit F
MTSLDVALAVLAAAFICSIVRAVRGPSIADRSLAADMGFYAIVGATALLALRSGATQFLDLVLIGTMLGFLATVALAALVGRQGS